MFLLGVGIQKSAWGWKTSLRTQMFQKNQCAANMAGGLSSWQTCSEGGRASPLLPLPPVCSEWLWLFSAPFQEKSSETSIWGRETSWLLPESMCTKSILYLNTVSYSMSLVSLSVEAAITWQTTGQFLKQPHIYGDWEMEDQMSAGSASWASNRP